MRPRLESEVMKNGSRKLGYAKMGAETKARLSLSKASAQATVQTKGTFFFVKAIQYNTMFFILRG